jgi:hypothetical protein
MLVMLNQAKGRPNRNVVSKKQMTCECRPHAVVILDLTPDNGVKPKKEKPK